MNQKNIYQAIHDKYFEALRSGNIKPDPYLSGHERDSRRGISLIIPCESLGPVYYSLKNNFEASCPGQYFYPLKDLHITVFDYLPGSIEYQTNQDLDELYSELSAEVLKKQKPFTIDFQDVVFSDEAGLIAGYDKGRLVELRKKIREELAQRKIQFTERYTSQTAHVTFIRFVKVLSDADALLKQIEYYRQGPFFSLAVEEFQLVEHDWYNRRENLRLIAGFPLA